MDVIDKAAMWTGLNLVGVKQKVVLHARVVEVFAWVVAAVRLQISAGPHAT